MWFLLGLVSLVGFALFFVRWRAANRWQGVQARTGSHAYEYHLQKYKGKLQKIFIGVPCDSAIEFCLKPESTVDRVFKGLGLSQEQQLNRLHFDEKVYIVSDDPRLSVQLKRSSDLPVLLANMFEEQRFMGARIGKLWCQQRRLWVECIPAKNFDESEVGGLSEQVLPLLTKVRDALLAKSDSPGTVRDHFIAKAAILLGISTALAVGGGVQTLRSSIIKFPVVLDLGALWQSAILVGGVLLAGLIVLCIAWLGRTSRAHLVLIELLLVGSVGCVLTAYSELRDYNVEFDTREVRNEIVQATRFYTSRCGKRKRSTCYHVQIAPFAGKSEGLKLKLSYATYTQLHGHAQLVLPLHSGALGWRWIEEPTADFSAASTHVN